tara:strand:- start:3961 stop:4227 length:267 start_codon:yes stop_codon:yes gene_type:complete
MLKKFINIFSFVLLISFIIFLCFFYLSEENIIKTNKARINYTFKVSTKTENIPLIKNDTADIIEYKNDVEIYKNKKKTYKFFDLINKE